jgi:hypothetical protein
MTTYINSSALTLEISVEAGSVGLSDKVVVQCPGVISCRLPLPHLGCMLHCEREQALFTKRKASGRGFQNS